MFKKWTQPDISESPVGREKKTKLKRTSLRQYFRCGRVLKDRWGFWGFFFVTLTFMDLGIFLEKK